MKQKMSIWGVGPQLALVSVLYATLMLVLHYLFYPFFVISRLPLWLSIAFGVALLAIGLPFLRASIRAINRGFDNGVLLKNGVYGVCRNPLYGSFIYFIVPGIVLLFRSWTMITVPVFMYLIFLGLVGKEERYLHRTFGPEFETYRKKTPRVFPNPLRLWSLYFRVLPTGAVSDEVFSVRDRYVNLYIIRMKGRTIAVDAGVRPAWIKGELSRLDIKPESVSHVFLTHGDFDHIGGLSVFPNAKIYLNAAEKPLLDGLKPRAMGFIFNKKPTEDFIFFQDGQTIEVDSITVKALACPGHTPGSSGFLIDNRYLFTGDALNLENGLVKPFFRVFNMDTKRQRESIRELAGLENVEILCTAHTGCSRDFRLAMGPWADLD